MESEQLALSSEVMTVMRGAATYARTDGAAFVAPGHLLLALLDAQGVGDVLGRFLERDRIVADAKRPRLPDTAEIPEAPLPFGESAPFKRYDTLAFRTADGRSIVWLDRCAFKVFIEGARRADAGAYRPKHLVLGYLTESLKDPELQGMLGHDPHAVTTAIFDL